MTQCEFWSGEDFVRAKGSVEISIPHTYSVRFKRARKTSPHTAISLKA